jgi:hypothetical protein
MNKIFFFILMFCTAAAAQNYSDSLKKIENDYKSFRYEEVIKSADNLLEVNSIPSGVKTELYMMKGISHFVILEDTLAKYSFLEILKIDPSYSPDSIIISPKIVKFFNEIKENYAWYYVPKETIPEEPVINISIADSLKVYNNKFRSSVIRSLIFPGLGHLFLDKEIGWYLTVPAALSFISSVYFIINTENRRSDYLVEQNPTEISGKYKAYNSSYKLRNVSITIFGVIWLFSQFDILNSDYITAEPIPGLNPYDQSVNISLKISF